jgi:hypothetical protein
MEGVVILGTVMGGASGMAAASSYHGERTFNGPYLLQYDQSSHGNAPTPQHAADGYYEFWNTTAKSRGNDPTRNLSSQPIARPQQNRKPEYAYDFWNSVDKSVPASYGMTGPTKEVGPCFRASSSQRN